MAALGLSDAISRAPPAEQKETQQETNCEATNFEDELLAQSSSRAASNSMLQTMLEQLDAAVYRHGPSNAAQNAKLWDLYAKEHGSKPKWLQNMAAAVGQDAGSLPQIGCEWSDADSLQHILQNWLQPLLPKEGVVAEIACGGGRIAAFIASCLFTGQDTSTVRFVASDVSSAMLAAARQATMSALSGCTLPDGAPQAVQFHHTPTGSGAEWQACMRVAQGGSEAEAPLPLQTVVCFDAMVHMELQVQSSYIQAIANTLAPGGVCLLTTADMTSPLGWQRFQTQRRSTVAGFVWSTPEATRHMLTQAGLEIVKESCTPGQPRELTGNLYLDRDYVVVARRPTQSDS